MPPDGASIAAMPASTQQIVEQLRQAVAKGICELIYYGLRMRSHCYIKIKYL